MWSKCGRQSPVDSEEWEQYDSDDYTPLEWSLRTIMSRVMFTAVWILVTWLHHGSCCCDSSGEDGGCIVTSQPSTPVYFIVTQHWNMALTVFSLLLQHQPNLQLVRIRVESLPSQVSGQQHH